MLLAFKFPVYSTEIWIQRRSLFTVNSLLREFDTKVCQKKIKEAKQYCFQYTPHIIFLAFVILQ